MNGCTFCKSESGISTGTVEKRACNHTDLFLRIESVSLFYDKKICWQFCALHHDRCVLVDMKGSLERAFGVSLKLLLLTQYVCNLLKDLNQPRLTDPHLLDQKRSPLVSKSKLLIVDQIHFQFCLVLFQNRVHC